MVLLRLLLAKRRFILEGERASFLPENPLSFNLSVKTAHLLTNSGAVPDCNPEVGCTGRHVGRGYTYYW